MDSDQQRRFVELYAKHQDRVYAYIVALSPNWSDAEEILDQTTVKLWEKWEQFDPDRDFVPWACGIARYEVLKYFARPSRREHSLSPEVMEQIAEEFAEAGELFDLRSRALDGCIEQLSADHRELLHACYSGRQKIQDIAQQWALSANAVSSRLKRIRQLLHRCIDRAVARENR